MTWMEFVSKVIDELAWPVVVVLAIALFRRSLERLLDSDRLTALKAGPGGFDLEFARDMESAKAKIHPGESATTTGAAEPRKGDEAASALLSPDITSESYVKSMLKIAEVSPRTAVLLSYGHLEAVLKEAARTVDPAAGAQVRHDTFLRNHDVLSQSELDVCDTLRRQAGRMDDQPDNVIGQSAAMDYVQLARDIAMSVRLGLGKPCLDDSSS